MSTAHPASPPPRARIRVEYVGDEHAPVLVVEDLLADPGPLVAAAHAARYGAPEMKAYPGLRATAPRAYALGLRAALLPAIRDAFGLPGWEVAGAICDFSLVTRRPEALEPRQRVPHTDTSDPALIALLHYLTPGGCGGTSFYRHRATGFETITAERRARYEATLAMEIGRDPPSGYTSGGGPLFARTGGFEGSFNRLIAYRGDLLHSGDVPRDSTFSDDPRRGRLTLNTFFTLRPPGAPSL